MCLIYSWDTKIKRESYQIGRISRCDMIYTTPIKINVDLETENLGSLILASLSRHLVRLFRPVKMFPTDCHHDPEQVWLVKAINTYISHTCTNR